MDPVHSSPGLEVVGLSSVTPWGYQRGRLRRADLERAVGTAPRGGAAVRFRVVVLHHQLAGAPWRTRKRPLSGRSRVLRRLAAAGAELILGGHVHQATIAERRDFEVTEGETRACVLATAPGLGRPRPNGAHEARGVLVHRADEREISVEAYVWQRRELARGPARAPSRAVRTRPRRPGARGGAP